MSDGEVPDMEKQEDPPLHSFFALDWKEPLTREQLQAALTPFGLHVYDDPEFEGSDSVGFLICTEELSKEQVEALVDWDDAGGPTTGFPFQPAVSKDEGEGFEQADQPGEVFDET